MKVGLHQGQSIFIFFYSFSPLLYIIVINIVAGEMCGGWLWELLYADDLFVDNIVPLILFNINNRFNNRFNIV